MTLQESKTLVPGELVVYCGELMVVDEQDPHRREDEVTIHLEEYSYNISISYLGIPDL